MDLGILFQDLCYGARSLIRTRAFTATVVAVLALAIGANTALFSVIEAVLLRPLPYRDYQRLAVVWKTVPSKHIEWDWASGPIVRDWRDRNHTFEDVAIFLRPEASLVTYSTKEGPEKIQASKTSGDFFGVLAVQPLFGRVFSRGEAHKGDRLAVLSYRFWESRLGADRGVLGKTLRLDDDSFTIVGVMPPDFQVPDQNTAMWLPLASDPRWELWQQERFRIADAFGVLVRLKPGRSVADAQMDMNRISQGLAQEHPKTDADLGVRVVPLLEQVVGSGVRRAMFLLEGALLCVLLIACSNIASLLAVRGRGRRRELAIRMALGASRRQILLGLAMENLILFLFGGLLGLAVAEWALRLFLSLVPQGVPRLAGAGLNLTVFAFTVVLSLLAGGIFGMLPALQAAGKDPEPYLHDAGRTESAGPATHRLRRMLVTTQFALAVILLGAAGLLVRSFRLLLDVNPGFDTSHLLTVLVELPSSRYNSEESIRAFMQRSLDKLNALPGVRKAVAGSANIAIVSGQMPDESIVTADQPLTPDFQRHRRDLVSDDYFRVMGIPLLAGRLFSAEDVYGGPASAVINQTMARRFWPGKNPLGQRFKEVLQGTGGTWMTVVGVVRDISSNRDGSVDPTFYRSIRQWALTRMEIVIRTASPPGFLVPAVRKALRSVDPSLPPFDVTPVEQHLRELDAPRRFETSLLGIFAACALLLAMVGLHGLLMSSVQQRTREIGIRVALGATAASVIRLVLREGLICVLAGTAVGMAGEIVAGHALSAWLFRITPTDTPTLLVVIALLGFVTLGVSSATALRSTRIDPVIALRQD
ncbi:MAG TPA: ABC transporter permease [Bryobacteraceae bacterium]|nr:ABC transporter permease [Bryobacteraceae bacterium]